MSESRKSVDEIEKYALELSVAERSDLMARLAAHEGDVEQAWADEAESRLDDLLSGREKGIPAGEVLSELRAKFSAKS